MKRNVWGGAIAIAVLCWGCTIFAPAPPIQSSAHLQLGNPSHQQTLDVRNQWLVQRPQYAMLYNRQRGTAEWVAWQLNRSWKGDLGRAGFTIDPELPAGWYAVATSDYTNSGFDRGHLVPAADRDRTEADVASVFYMTNIAPQSPDNNRGPWEELESYCRELALDEGKELFIYAGPTGTGGNGSNGFARTLDQGRVTVPAAFWKIVVVQDPPGEVTAQTRVIAVLMPNRQGIRDQSWTDFRTTVRSLEKLTGYDFLSALPSSLQDELETQKDR